MVDQVRPRGRGPTPSLSGPQLRTAALPPTAGTRFEERGERPDADPGRALAEVAALAGSERRTGDVQVRPGGVTHELPQEDRRADRPAPAVAVVLHVGDVRPERLLLQIHQRKPPEGLPGASRRGEQ